MLLFRNRAVFVAPELTYGSEPVIGPADALLAREVEITPLNIDYAVRELVRAQIGNFAQLPAAKSVQLRILVELAGTDDPGTAPPWAPLMRACGIEETLQAPGAPGSGIIGSATYKFANDGLPTEDSVSVYFFIDNQLFRALGCRGSARIFFGAGEIPTLEFTVIGLYAPVSTAVQLATGPGYARSAAPVPCNRDNTRVNIDLAAGGLSTVCAENIGLDIGNRTVYRNLIGCEGVRITDSLPVASVLFELTRVADRDYFSRVASGKQMEFLVSHNLNNVFPNERVQLSFDAQVLSPTLSEQDGVVMFGADCVGDAMVRDDINPPPTFSFKSPFTLTLFATP